MAALALLALAASSAWHGARERARGPWTAAGMYACAAVILLAADGVLRPLTAGVLAFLSLALAAGLALAGGRAGAGRAALGHAGAGIGYLGADARGIWQRIMARLRGGEGERGETEAVVAGHVSARMIPPVREDPALGLPPEPAAIASVPAPAPYAALAAWIAGFEPEDDQALTMFMQGHAAGGIAVADAWRGFADTCLGSVGLDPAYVAGILEVGDTESESAAHKAQVHKRFGVIYQAVQEWISAGRMLPHKAREFLTGDGV
jgi:hypothetical protein